MKKNVSNPVMKDRKHNHDRWNIDSKWSGTAMIYVVSGTALFSHSGDYQVSYKSESEPEDLRAARLYRASRGEDVGEVRRDKLGDELVVIFGAKMTAARAVEALQSLMARIQEGGFMIGRVGASDFIHESVEDELTVDDVEDFDIPD